MVEFVQSTPAGHVGLVVVVFEDSARVREAEGDLQDGGFVGVERRWEVGLAAVVEPEARKIVG